MFNDRAGLLDPESILRDFALLSAQQRKGASPLVEVRRLLWKLWGMHDNHKLEVRADRIVVHGPWGGIPFHALGDGYRGTGTWLLDFLGNSLKAGRWTRAKEAPLSGIVLLDEMDEHLHPRWQRTLVPTLRRLLPHVQFVATTHSPLALVNTRAGELWGVHTRNTVAELSTEPLGAAEGRTPDELLLGDWFGLESTLDLHSEKKLRALRAARKGGDSTRAKALEEELRGRLGSFLTSPLDPLAQEIADSARAEFRAEVGPEKRAELVRSAAKQLRARIAPKSHPRRRAP
ncbi:MAG: AAA family ATPase [Polyangiaceae bacterium]